MLPPKWGSAVRGASNSLFGALCLPLCLSLCPKRAESDQVRDKVEDKVAQPPNLMRLWPTVPSLSGRDGEPGSTVRGDIYHEFSRIVLRQRDILRIAVLSPNHG